MHIRSSHIGPNVLDNDGYESLIQRFPLPDEVIGTKPLTNSREWHTGAKRSALHNCWQICTDDPTKKRFSTISVSHDSTIDVDGVTLADIRYRHDLLTKKTLCIKLLTQGRKRKRLGSAGIAVLMSAYDWFLRWRISIGIQRNADLTRAHFHDYVNRSTSEVCEFIPLAERLDRLADEISAGAYALQFSARNPDHIDWLALGLKLGVSHKSIAASKNTRQLISDRMDRLAPHMAERVRPNLVGGRTIVTQSATRCR